MALIELFRQSAPAGSRLVVEADDTFAVASLPAAEQLTCRPLSPAILYLLSTGAANAAELVAGS